MMTAYDLARICQELFGDVEYATIDMDRDKHLIDEIVCIEHESEAIRRCLCICSGRVVVVNTHSYYSPVTTNYLLIRCDKFCKVVRSTLLLLLFL